MPLDPNVKQALRAKVSTATRASAADLIAEVTEAQANLPADDKDYARLTGWLEDLREIAGGSVIGRDA